MPGSGHRGLSHAPEGRPDMSNGNSFGSSGANAIPGGTLACLPSWLSATRFTIRPGQK